MSGRAYEFVNDVVREVLYESTPAPTRLGWHRRAADLAGDNYESMAHHAEAAGETGRSARAWLLAAEAAFARFAVSDAEALASRAVDSAVSGDVATEVVGRARLVRARALEAREAYADALVDLRAVAELAREAGDQRLEMTAQRQLAGDVPVALGLGTGSCVPHVDRGLVLARSIGDRGKEADLLGRRAVLMSNRLQLDEAVTAGEAAVAAGRSSNDPVALVAALDGLKTALSFVGDVRGMRAVIDELEPHLRRQGDLWRLQWCVFEQAYPAVADGDLAPRRGPGPCRDRDQPPQRVRRVRHLVRGPPGLAAPADGTRRGGRGDRPACGRRTRRHGSTRGGGRRPACCSRRPWSPSANERRRPTCWREGLAAAEQDDSRAYLLGCRALLADVTGDPAMLAAADAMLREVRAPARAGLDAGLGVLPRRRAGLAGRR